VGSDGRLRVSLRHLDEALSTDDVPATASIASRNSPSEIAEVEIDLLPIALAFRAGDQLRFVVSSRNLLSALMPGVPRVRPAEQRRARDPHRRRARLVAATPVPEGSRLATGARSRRAVWSRCGPEVVPP
jgi:predicted acyl esterase